MKEVYSVFLSNESEEIFMEMASECLADVLMAARGWLMLSMWADVVRIYDEEGFEVGAYKK